MPVRRDKPAKEGELPVDHLVISLRSYVTKIENRPLRKTEKPSGIVQTGYQAERTPPSDWVLVFDCETATTPDQKLKFGTYQLRHKGRLFERGAFYEPDALTPHEKDVLWSVVDAEVPSDDGEVIYLRTRAEFVEEVFFKRGYRLGAQIVGLNLPFDISRLAIGHVNARGAMKGGFSFILVDDKNSPKVSVKHLSQRASLIRFTGTKLTNNRRGGGMDESLGLDEPRTADRGYFVDLKTLAATLTSESHSLDSLAVLLGVPSQKLTTERHGATIDAGYVHYAFRDTQTTWECFEDLSKQFAERGLGDTGLYELYSEASLGKAYLKAMAIKPWHETQPGFPPSLTGHIMSTYYGGRSEVHIRREITPIIHFDFLSMYPTVCTLMGLWRFTIANGTRWSDETARIRKFVSECNPTTLRKQVTWRKLTAILQVLPQDDVFPVRAHYTEDQPATIGLNHLTSNEPMWFTLADVLVSKILTGKTPRILKAIQFRPDGVQQGLRPITVAGQEIHPAQDDFYKSLIMHRLTLKKKQAEAFQDDTLRLESDILAIKILANSTSYGIFVELNIKDYDRAQDMTAYGVRDNSFKISSKKFEQPGRYFYPLLGTLITGAARLMLALAERQVIDQGLDWALCDTDSLAIANPENLPLDQFKAKALAVQEWFSSLNPYDSKESILQLEKVNFPRGTTDIAKLEPPHCLAISAKRYVLFNRRDTKLEIRKASGHGLGHLVPPYDEPTKTRRARVKAVGVPVWQEDLWHAIIRATDSGKPDQVDYDALKNFSIAAASQYAATTPALLDWFRGFNEGKPYAETVKPFNFLLSLQAKSRIEMASADMNALRSPLWRKREPRPAAPFSKDPAETITRAFDREISKLTSIPASWLKSLARSLVRYHLHPEAKFLSGHFEGMGVLPRRRVHAIAFQAIGKEADNIEEREFIGDGEEDIEHVLAREDRMRLRKHILSAQNEMGISDRLLCAEARISTRTFSALRKGRMVNDIALFALAEAVSRLRNFEASNATDEARALARLKDRRAEFSSDTALAESLGVSRSYATRLLSGNRSLTGSLIVKLLTP